MMNIYKYTITMYTIQWQCTLYSDNAHYTAQCKMYIVFYTLYGGHIQLMYIKYDYAIPYGQNVSN